MNTDRRKKTRTLDLPKYKEDFTLAVDVEAGDTITRPERGSEKVTHVELGVDFNMKWVVLISVKGDTIPEPYSPRAYLPIS